MDDLWAVICVVLAIGFTCGLAIAFALPFVHRHALPAVLIVASGGTAIAVMLVFRSLNRSEILDQNDRLGLDGELVVAELLRGLIADGYRVFDDVPPERRASHDQRVANFDHVLVGPAGVFVIETKTRSKRTGKNEIRVTADGRVLVNGFKMDRNPLAQARTLAKAMQRFLQLETGINVVPMRPVVVFPGWYIHDREYQNAKGDVWTLNETAIVKWIRAERDVQRLHASDILRIANALESLTRQSRSASRSKAATH